MKTYALALSLILNVLLAGYVILDVTVNRPRIPAPQVSSPVIVTTPQAPASVPEPHEPGRFQWKQLEADNYAAFVHNLRAAGCPEQTIADLVTAEITRIYAQKREELQLSNGWLAPSVIDSLRAQQEDAIATAMGWPPPNRNSPQKGVSELAAQGVKPPAPPPKMPLALIDPNPDFLLNDQQISQLNDLRQDFLEAIGGPNQDPSSPEYLAKWSQAQAEADQRFKILFGQQAVLKQQLQANQAPEQ